MFHRDPQWVLCGSFHSDKSGTARLRLFILKHQKYHEKVSQKFSRRAAWLILGCDQWSCSAVIWTTCQLPVRQYFCFVCSGRSTHWSNGTTELVPSDGRELRPRVCWRVRARRCQEGTRWLLLLLPGALSLQLSAVTWRGTMQSNAGRHSQRDPAEPWDGKLCTNTHYALNRCSISLAVSVLHTETYT